MQEAIKAKKTGYFTAQQNQFFPVKTCFLCGFSVNHSAATQKRPRAEIKPSNRFSRRQPHDIY